MLQSAIYADLYAHDFSYSFVSRLQTLPSKVAGKVSFARLGALTRGLLRQNELRQLNAHLRRDIGLDD